jgi:hypothetical protein
MNKISEIIGAWILSFNPSKERKELAEKRYEICLECEHYGKKRRITGDEFCKKCLCSIQKKIFTEKTEKACPLNKWSHIDNIYMSTIDNKSKSII